jgi:hypothetical protein
MVVVAGNLNETQLAELVGAAADVDPPNTASGSRRRADLP